MKRLHVNVAVGGPVPDEGQTTCCYARSTKQWISDPQGVARQTFLTDGNAPVYGDDRGESREETASACCD